MKESITELKIPMFVHNLTIVLTTDIIKSRNKFNDELEGPYYDDGCPPKGLCASNAKTLQVFIFLPPKLDTELIAHESFHAICAIYSTIGSTLNEGSEELYAYGLGYICGEIEKFIRSQKRYFKRKKKKK